MKKLQRMGALAGLIVTGVAMYAGTQLIASHYLEAGSEKVNKNKTICDYKGQEHVIKVHDNTLDPMHTDAKRCDSLTVVNADKQIRIMAFGVHEKHITYDGISEKNLDSGQQFTVTLNKTGTFKVHDHLQEEVGGTFTVKP
jgi:hypothetical protein